MKVVAEYEPTKWRVQKIPKGESHWVFVGDFESLEKAQHRAKDLAQFYNIRARVLELPK